jgi:hypothetical protein
MPRGLTRVAVMWLFTAVAACGRDVPVYEGQPFSRDPPPIGPLHGRLVTSNSGDDTLSVVPLDGVGPVGRLPVGFSPVELEGPHHIAVDPAGRYLYVNLSLAVNAGGSGPHGTHGTGSQQGWVLKIDARDGRTVGTVQVDRNPGDNVLGADGRTLFVTHYDLIAWTMAGADLRRGDSPLIAIDVERMAVMRSVPLCPAAHAVRLSGDGGTLYATCGPDEIAVVDLRDPTWPVRRVPLPDLVEAATCRACPYALSVAPDGTVWVSTTGAPNTHGGVHVYDPSLGAFDPGRSLIFHGAAMFVSFAPQPDGSFHALIPEQEHAGGWLHMFAPRGPGQWPADMGAFELTMRDCMSPHMAVVSADGRRAHLVCEGDHSGPGSVVWLDLAAIKVIGSVPVGVFPDGLALVPSAR